MDSNLLGAIASNNGISDISAALDYRQARLDRDEAKRKEIRQNQLVGKALSSGLAEGSVMHEMASTVPQSYLAITKVMGIDPSDGAGVHQMTQDADIISAYGKAGDINGAVNYMQESKAQRDRLGLPTKHLTSGLQAIQEDAPKFLRATQMISDTFHPKASGAMNEKDREDIRLKEKELDWKMSRPAGGDSAPVESIQTWNQYQKLGGDKTEEGRQFGRSHSFISKEGQQLSAYTDKALGEAIDSSNTLSTDAGRYRAIASDLMANAKNMKVGALSSMSEYVKDFTGGQDDITSLRKQALQIVNSEAIKSLPPGSATEVDTAMALAPLPKENADPIYIAKWLQSVARLNEKAAEYNTFKANYISEKGHQRDLLSSWKNKNKAQPVQKDKTVDSDQIKSLLEKY